MRLSAGQAYHKSIAGSDLFVFDNCGHRPEVEQTAVFVERVRRFLAETLWRVGQPQDVANAVVFLASGAASFITGQTLSVSSGYTMMWTCRR